MRFASRCQSVKFRLGELLLSAGIISPDVLSHGLSIARRAAMPIGRVLIMSGHVSDLDIDCAVQTQNSIREGAIDEKLAKELLRFSHVHQCSINEAYRLNGIARDLGPLCRFGKLVLAAGVVDESGLKCAVKYSSSSCLPLGKSLVELNLISEDLHIHSMNLQILVRDERISFLEAVKVLQAVNEEGVELEKALARVGYKNLFNAEHPRLGELMVAAGIISYEDSLVLTELGTENDTSFGKLLLDYKLATAIDVEAALLLQKMFSTPMFTMRRAIRLLKMANAMQEPLEKLLTELDILEQVVKLLRDADYIEEGVLRKVAAEIVEFEQTVAEALVTRGVVTPRQSKAGLDCLKKIESKEISYEEALELLNIWRLDLTGRESAPVRPSLVAA